MSSLDVATICEENVLALPSLPYRIARLSNVASPSISTGLPMPQKAFGVNCIEAVVKGNGLNINICPQN